jgi:putative transposase
LIWLPDALISSYGKAVGIDVGLTHFAITSDGSKFDNPKPLKKREQNFKRKQQNYPVKRRVSVGQS